MEEQFLKAYERYADAVYRYCFVKLSDTDAALDAVQDTFMRYWDTIRSGTPVRHEQAFLFTVARRIVIDRYRARPKRPVSLEELGERGFEPSGGAEDIETSAEATRAFALLARLPAEYRDALELRYVEGLEPREIAEVLNESANAVSVRINRGIAKLRAEFERKPL